ncbi:18S rRNA pseudouridine methyltransferase [Tulasnella sp. 418]|nr:18S rRNA pseudouridine methyltransferase [Tulasnella sp. 418]
MSSLLQRRHSHSSPNDHDSPTSPPSGYTRKRSESLEGLVKPLNQISMTMNVDDPAPTSPVEPQPSTSRPTKPLPAQSKTRRQPHPPPNLTNPSLLPIQPTIPKTAEQKESTRRLIVVLEQACLEAYKVSSGGSGSGAGRAGSGKDAKYALLNCDDHQGILAKTGRDIADARPDITHQCLLTLLDSPLNKAGRLQVYIHTAKGVLIEINPQVRIPRTFKRFSGLMVQLLHTLSIRGVSGSEKLLKVIKNPVTDHFPVNTYKITLSGDAPTVRLSEYLPTLPQTHSIAVFVGAMARGADNFADDIVDEKISISNYALSASVACGKFCCAMEELLEIV